MEYEPGVCNIGDSEQRKRYALGAGSFGGAIVLVAAVVVANLPTWALLFSLFPIYGAALGFLQGRERFCAGFAARGIYDVGTGQREIGDATDREADRDRALRLNAKALAVAVVGAVVVYVGGRILL